MTFLALISCAVLLDGGPGSAAAPADRAAPDAVVAKVKEFHGGSGPWAVVGYRMGEHALRAFRKPRGSFEVGVVHHSPAEVQYACMCDGLQASTGASVGKLNLKMVEAKPEGLCTEITDRATGRTIRYTIKPELAKAILDLPLDRLEAEGKRVAGLPDDELFVGVSAVK